MSDGARRCWSADIEALAPYVPGEQPAVDDLLKLNTNESPFSPAPGVAAAVATACAALARYPDPQSRQLRGALADYHGLGAEQVFVGNGSDEVLAHIFRALFQRRGPLLFPDISYSFYPVYASLFGIDYRSVPLDDELAIDPAAYCGARGGVIFPNPNAPTGRLLALPAVAAIAAQNRHCAVVVDEAYIDFGGESALALLDRFDNLLVVRTFSKSRALAGLRVGYALGAVGLIEALVRVKDSFNSYPIDRLAEAGALASLADEAHFRASCQRLIACRASLAEGLVALGFECLPSAANFLFVRHRAQSAVALAAALRERRVIVRHFAQPRIADWLRISVGDREQCARLLDALAECLHPAP